MKKIYFTVTNDLSYDQRMKRICNSLAENGYAITLVGFKRHASLPLQNEKYRQKRVPCWFTKGKLFYFEYNLRLLLLLFFRKMDVICAIDLDTIVPCYLISRLKRIPRVYDAHELFTELKEVATRPRIRKLWTRVEKKWVPKFRLGYTVSESIAEEFHRRYGISYQTILNTPVLRSFDKAAPGHAQDVPGSPERFILYQGAVNEARGFEYLVPAMQQVNTKLIICGDGNFMPQLKKLIKEYKQENKIELKGMLLPEELWHLSQKATIGIALAEKTGLNQWLAMPNKFFDYLHAGLPQITMDYPEYRKLNAQYEVAVLIPGLEPGIIADAINDLLRDEARRKRLHQNCLRARQEWNWSNEEKKLLAFYHKIFHP